MCLVRAAGDEVALRAGARNSERKRKGSLSGLVAAARLVATEAALRAPGEDRDQGFPAQDVAGLARAGLLAACVPKADGGAGLGEEQGATALLDVLRIIGSGSLALGRIYEGHVNALQLIARHGGRHQRAQLFADADAGHLFGVWNTEPASAGLEVERRSDGLLLHGCKTFASGAGHVTRALVTARMNGKERDGEPLMLVVALEAGDRADLSAWRAHGMRASATGTLDFEGMTVPGSAILGGKGDYHAQPMFSGGAWRFAAVQLGGIEAVLGACRQHLQSTARGGDPHQLARLGEAAIAVETARLWVERAASMVSADVAGPERIIAYVNLARLAVERAGLEVLERAQRSVGLQGFLRDHPLERLSRDLATYLRQPAPDRALVTAARHVLEAPQSIGELWRDGDLA